MIRSLLKNLFRFSLYTLVAFTLYNYSIPLYLIDLALTTLMLVSYYCLKDLVKSMKLGGIYKKITETDCTDGQFSITVMIYAGAVLSPALNLLSMYILNLFE